MRIELHSGREQLTTTAAYDTQNNCILVYVKGRALVDICRSIAHELTHHKQNNEGRITNSQEDGQDGSDMENEANATAGIIMRKYGKLNPDIYQ
jgi:Zn-dependent peptidase ImmA (M78 family)